MNIVVSSTFGWNIGDQFILRGVIDLLRWSINQRLHFVYHDRNPVKLPTGGEESHTAIRSGWADALVIAGSPGWTGECSAIYRTALDHNVPIYLIGIGTGVSAGYLAEQVKADANISEALAAAKVVVCRDEIARDESLRYRESVSLLPCPAILNGLSSDLAGWPSQKRVALGEYYSGPSEGSDMVAHSASDLERSGGKAFYSADVTDYLNVYAGAGQVVSSRLHASVLRLAFDLPVTNLWPHGDDRCTATWSVLEEGVKQGLDQIASQYIEILT